MRLLYYGKDGGPESTVWGFWLIEIKSLFSIALLKFEHGSRDAYHNHAFNCISWLLKGHLLEEHLDGTVCEYKPSLLPIITTRGTFHKVSSFGRTWVLTFRGPWSNAWNEFSNGKLTTLTHGRKNANNY